VATMAGATGRMLAGRVALMNDSPRTTGSDAADLAGLSLGEAADLLRSRKVSPVT